jgi:hypothetical protein
MKYQVSYSAIAPNEALERDAANSAARLSLCVMGVARVSLVRRVRLGSVPPPFPTLAVAAFGAPAMSLHGTTASVLLG